MSGSIALIAGACHTISDSGTAIILAGSKAMKDKIIITGYVPDEDLSPIYTEAMAFVFPSFYEGFGLPPLEAMTCGTPVIASSRSSLPEVIGNAGIMIEPDNINKLKKHILKIYYDDNYRKQLSISNTLSY
jgi:glycosyltransferase involved in cell wall biosynthesis